MRHTASAVFIHVDHPLMIAQEKTTISIGARGAGAKGAALLLLLLELDVDAA